MSHKTSATPAVGLAITLGLNMTDTEISEAYVRYHLGGAESDSWAPEELSQLAIDDPRRTWKIIQQINAIPIEDEAWSSSVHSSVGCGALEDLIALHEGTMLPVILDAAKDDALLQRELSTIYQASVSLSAWTKISGLLEG